jgi:nicotinamidase-related amidase
MTYAAIDPSKTMVLFADHQAGIIERATTMEQGRLRKGISALAKLAKLFDMPVVLTMAAGEAPPSVVPEITAVLGTLPFTPRTTTDSFLHAPTRAAIEDTGRKTLLVCGVATEIIVQHTCLSAQAAGFDVQVVVDATGGISERTEQAALMRMVQAGVVTTSLPSLAGQLASDFSKPKAGEAIGILFEMAS